MEREESSRKRILGLEHTGPAGGGGGCRMVVL